VITTQKAQKDCSHCDLFITGWWAEISHDHGNHKQLLSNQSQRAVDQYSITVSDISTQLSVRQNGMELYAYPHLFITTLHQVFNVTSWIIALQYAR